MLRPVSLILAGLLAACTVGPDYVPPQPEVPASWHEPLFEGASTEDFAATEWWSQLEDDTLTALIRRGVENSPTLAQAFARVLQSHAVRGQVAGAFVPDVDAQGSYSRSRSSETLLGVPVQDSSTWNVGLTMFWEIDLFGRLRRSLESADAALQADVELYRDVLTSLQAEIATAYVRVRTLQRRLQLAQANVTSQTASRDLAQARFETEVAPELDVVQGASNLANTEAQLPLLRLALAQTRHRLATLLGLHAEQLPAQIGEPAPIPTPPQQIAIGLPTELLRRRPDVRAAERVLAAQFAQIGVAEALRYPQISLLGSIGLASPQLDQLARRDSRTFSIQPGLAWNLFDGGRVRGAVAEREALAQEARLRFANTVLLANEEVEGAIAAFREQRVRSDALRRVVDASRRASELAQQLYRDGLSDFQNVLDAQRTLFAAEDALAQSQGDQAEAAIQLFRALGGGWTPPETQTGDQP